MQDGDHFLGAAFPVCHQLIARWPKLLHQISGALDPMIWVI